ncbi:MAG: hypothetical protein R3290_04575 [Acidimicrobiia bacterium]|nr:hypothetical protein [Acidimicrobiia bacterium]
MFVDIVTTSLSALEDVVREGRLLSDPPEAMAAMFSWHEDDGQITTITVWDSAGERGDFAAERMMPLFEAGTLGEQHGSPRPVRTVHTYIRD